jgi:Uma2 family endonuclease
VQRIQQLLTDHVDQGDLGAVFRGPWPVELSKYDLVKPDVAFVSWGREGVIRVDGIYGAPELVVEVTSPESAHRDRGEKKRLYQWAGVFEYWVVDPVNCAFDAFTRTRQGFQPIAVDGTTFQSVLLPDLELTIVTLFG